MLKTQIFLTKVINKNKINMHKKSFENTLLYFLWNPINIKSLFKKIESVEEAFPWGSSWDFKNTLSKVTKQSGNRELGMWNKNKQGIPIWSTKNWKI